jgi:Flp pilus assembly pilin Flp
MRHRRKLRDWGASFVEYALLIALIAFVAIAALTYFGQTNGGSINRSASKISSSIQ